MLKNSNSKVLFNKQNKRLRKILLLIYIGLLCLNINLYSQTETPPDTLQTDSFDYWKDYSYSYVEDVIEIEDTMTINLNDSLGIDSFELGTVYEKTFSFVNKIQDSPQNPDIGTTGGGGSTGSSTTNKGIGNSQDGVKPTAVVSPCECIEVDWYKYPIPPGETGWIKIKILTTIPDKNIKIIKVFLSDIRGIKPIAQIPIKLITNTKTVSSN